MCLPCGARSVQGLARCPSGVRARADAVDPIEGRYVALFSRFSDHIASGLDRLVASGSLPDGLDRRAISVEPPRDPAHGDVATNAAMVLAKPAGPNPRSPAELLVAELGALPEVIEASIAGPGFINLRVADDSSRDELALTHGEAGE